MSGESSSRRSEQFTPKRFYDPHPPRETVRITNVYATPWILLEDKVSSLQVASDHFRLGRVGAFYRRSKGQLPRVLHSEALDPTRLNGFKRWKGEPSELPSARLWIFAVPSRQVVAALTLDTTFEDILRVIELLEDCYYLDFHTEHGPLETHLYNIMRQHEVQDQGGNFLEERHQLTFAPSLPDHDYEDIIQRIIYRQDLPYRKEFSAIQYPAELNRRPGNTVAVGPYVSAICGHQNDVENCAVLSAVQAVASAARLREIRQAAYESVESYRHVDRSTMNTTTRRRILEDLADRLTDLELELSHSVEAPADIGLLVPSLRVESYHASLFNAMKLSSRCDIAARMLERLDRSISADLSAVQSIERRKDEDRRLRWSVAVGFVSTVAIPLSLILAFFGASAKEVNPKRSIFDHHYIWVYEGIGLVLVVSVLPSIALYIQQRRKNLNR